MGVDWGNVAGSFAQGMAGGTAGTNTGGSDSLWSNPTFWSAMITAGTSLVQGMYGFDKEEASVAVDRERLEEERRQFDIKQEFALKDLANALEIARINAGSAGRGASIAAQAELKQARANLMRAGAADKAAAMKVPLEARSRQAETAQITGAKSGDFFNQLIGNLQAPALYRSR